MGFGIVPYFPLLKGLRILILTQNILPAKKDTKQYHKYNICLHLQTIKTNKITDFTVYVCGIQ